MVLALLIYMSITLLNLRGQIQQAEGRRDEVQRQVDALTQSNAALSDVLSAADDPEAMEAIGRDQLGLAHDRAAFRQTHKARRAGAHALHGRRAGIVLLHIYTRG